MFKILSIFFVYTLLIQTTCFAGTAQVNNVLQFQGVSTTLPSSSVTIPLPNISTSGFVALAGSAASTTASDYYGLYPSAGGTQYQVPSGKTFYIIDIWVQQSGSASAAQLGYGTAALASEGTATAPTGAVYLASSGGTSIYSSFMYLSTGGAFYHFSFPGLSFPANSYPFWRPATAANFQTIVVGIVQ